MEFSNDRQNETGWSKDSEPLVFSKLSETSDNSISAPDELKVKVEIELKEEENGLIYQPDFYGHLQLVSLNQSVPNNCSAINNKQTGMLDWHCVQPNSICDKETLIIPTEIDDRFCETSIYGQFKNVCDSSSKTEETSTSNSLSTESEMYSYVLESTSQEQYSVSSQVCQIRKKRKRQLSYILAEKKREYRMRIKEENPSMWCAMKQKEACKKREQREERRLILLEMQKLMQLISIPDSSEAENHKLYLEALKDRYPDIWRQLIEALSSAEIRNQEIINQRNSKRRLSKPLKMYKDVVEAQKKYLYRQRLKMERPDLYEQQKARDSYARSIKRMLKKQLSQTQNSNTNS